jgi:hypothetical protein
MHVILGSRVSKGKARDGILASSLTNRQAGYYPNGVPHVRVFGHLYLKGQLICNVQKQALGN